MSELETRQRIVEVATAYFLKHGFSKVTTDELASELGMSKKTLYKHFATKEEILRDAVQLTMHDWNVNVGSLMRDPSMSIPEKLRKMMFHVANQYAKISRVFLDDLRRNAPNIWKEINEWRNKIILSEFRRFFREGAEQGLFRSDVPDHLGVLVYATAIQQMVNPDRMVELPYSMTELYEAVTKILYEGMLTDEGRRVMRETKHDVGFPSII